MASPNKIEQYNLQILCLELKSQGYNQDDIAQKLSAELQGSREIDDSISQSAVQRFLKKIKDQRSEEAGEIVRGYTQAAVPRDLELIEEVQNFLLSIKRNEETDPETGEVKDLKINIRDRIYAAVSLARVTFDKLKNLGALDPPETGETGENGQPNTGSPAVPTGSNVRSISERFGIGAGKQTA
ncbi:MAG TPA: hypothetical protein VMW06_03280 [Desulfobacterales bacterium]|nr:hypothetical protein [Desulfobacterales bacterium]